MVESLYRVPVAFLRPGMKVARPVYNAEGLILLNTGIVLRKSYIEQLKKFRIPAVYVAENSLPEELNVEEVVATEVKIEAMKMVREIMTEAREQAASHRAIVIDIPRVKKTVENIIASILSREDLIFDLADIRAVDAYTFGHSVGVCILTLLTGVTLAYTYPRLLVLGMGAILHDIGKIKIPEEILNKPGPLSPGEMKLVQVHPTFGFEILTCQKGISPTVARVALEHHERYSGEGYPRGLKGGRVHEFSYLTGIADIYDAVTADRIYRAAYSPHEAYELLAASGNYLFPFRISRAFLRNITPYPVSTRVLLSNGATGIVTAVNREAPYQPVVKVFGGGGELLPEVIDLTQGSLAIVKVLETKIPPPPLPEL